MVQLGIVVDEGVPARFVNPLVRALQDWRFELANDRIPLDESGGMPMAELARRYRSDHDWDIVLVITDLPLWRKTTPLVAGYSTEHRVALLSLPALGALRVPHRLRLLAEPLIALLALHSAEFPERIGAFRAAVQHIASDESGEDHHLALAGIRGRLQMLVGMVQANRPWRLVPSLEGATATAIAAGTLPIFYSFIWQMALSLQPGRLALISALAVAGMVTWFICYNRLWDRRSGAHEPAEAVLFNASTVLTLALGVTVMYVVLCLVIAVAAIAVIDGDYLQARVGHPAGVMEYVKIVWLASSMGIIAGALGSSFDSQDAVRHAAYSRRELERRTRRHQERPADQMT